MAYYPDGLKWRPDDASHRLGDPLVRMIVDVCPQEGHLHGVDLDINANLGPVANSGFTPGSHRAAYGSLRIMSTSCVESRAIRDESCLFRAASGRRGAGAGGALGGAVTAVAGAELRAEARAWR